MSTRTKKEKKATGKPQLSAKEALLKMTDPLNQATTDDVDGDEILKLVYKSGFGKVYEEAPSTHPTFTVDKSGMMILERSPWDNLEEDSLTYEEGMFYVAQILAQCRNDASWDDLDTDVLIQIISAVGLSQELNEQLEL